MKKIIVCILIFFGLSAASAFSVSGAAIAEPRIPTPVTDMDIPSVERLSPTQYRVQFSWMRPALSSTRLAASVNSWTARYSPHNNPFPAPNVPHGDLHIQVNPWHPFPSRYDIYFRDLTAGEAFVPNQPQFQLPPLLPPNPLLISPGAQPRINSGLLTWPLRDNRLYEVRVRPFRYAPVWTMATPVPGEPPRWSSEFIEVRLPEARQATEVTGLIMTDIRIHNVTASGSEIIIDFLDPGNVAGEPLVTDWRVAWRSAGAGGPAWFLNQAGVLNNGHLTIPRENVTTLATLVDGRPLNRITISGVRLSVATEIEVQIEPMRNGQALRFAPPGIPPRPAGGIFTIAGNQYVLQATNTPFTFYRPVFVQPNIYFPERMGDYLRIRWSSLGGLGHLPGRRVVLYELIGDDRVALLTIGSPAFQHINEFLFRLPVPRRSHVFQIVIYNPDDTVHAATLPSDPFHADIAQFITYGPTIYRAVAQGGVINDIFIRAFTRLPYTILERELAEDMPFDGYFADPNVRLLVYVTDDFSLLGSFIEGVWHFGDLTNNPLNRARIHPGDAFRNDENGPLLLHVAGIPGSVPLNQLPQISEFQTRNAAGQIVTLPLVGNRTYNIMVQSIRVDAEGDPLLIGGEPMLSEPAFFRVFMPPDAPIPIPPEMIAAPPLRIAERGPNFLDIEWDLRYFEIAGVEEEDEDGITVRWHSAIGIRDGEIVYGRDSLFGEGMSVQGISLNDILMEAEPEIMYILRNPNFSVSTHAERARELIDWARREITEWIIASGGTVPPGGILLRLKDMGATADDRYGFAIHTVSLPHLVSVTFGADSVSEAYEIYRDTFLWDDTEPIWSAWNTDIAGIEVTDGVARLRVSTANMPPGALHPNTPYVIFVLPYNDFNNRLHAFMPSFVVGTTLGEFDDPDPIPTVPVLHPWIVGMDYIGVRWRLQGELDPATGLPVTFEWDLFWTEFLLLHYPDHPDRNYVPWSEILEAIHPANDNPSGIWTVDGIPYIHFRIDGLFPSTDHHVWAIARNAESGLESAYANAVLIRTLDISPPLPPRNLGPATETQINMYNLLNSPDPLHSAQDPNALNIMFFRIWDDLDRSDGEDRGELTVPTPPPHGIELLNLPLPQFNALHITHFPGLNANTRYYVRARTILTIYRDGVSHPTRRQYAYEIQVADNPDFLDARSVIITPTEFLAVPAPNRLRAFSEWVVIPLRTGRDPGQFGGMHDPDQFPMPDRDFEITYDPHTQTLTWRFRTNRIGADGLPDQNVDQRFITRLIQERVFVYTIDLSYYQGLPITYRIVEIPVSIMSAFAERRIALVIETGEMSFRLPPGALNTAQVRALNQAHRDFFHIVVEYNPDLMPPLDVNTSFVTIPARFGVLAVGGGRTARLTAFNQPIGISVQTNGAPNMGLFRSGEGFVGWQDTRGSINWTDMSLSTTTSAPMTFAGIARNAPPVAPPGLPCEPSQDPEVNEAMERVIGRFNFLDLIEFDRLRVVTVHEFNNVVNALANGRTSVRLGVELTQGDRTALTRARLYSPSAGFNRATATDILVRLYELRTRQQIRPVTPLNSVPGLRNAPAALHNNLRKAADIGFITGPFFPNDPLTMGELMIMLDIIITDAGL